MHREAEECETQRLASQRDGGIVQAFSARVLVNRKALIGALKMVKAEAEAASPRSQIHAKGDVKTSFLHIRDIQEGESQHCILQSHYTTANLYCSLWQQ